MKNLTFFIPLLFVLSASCDKSNLLDTGLEIDETCTTVKFEAMLNGKIASLGANEILVFYKKEGKYKVLSKELGVPIEMSGKKYFVRAESDKAFNTRVKDFLDRGRGVNIALNRWGLALTFDADNP